MDNERIAFFDSKPYTVDSFAAANAAFGYRLKHFPNRLDSDTVALAKGFKVVCGFVNDRIDRPVIEVLAEQGVGLLALRCAGFNNVDLAAAKGRLRVVRVPAYSPHAVAEHTVALMLALDRKVGYAGLDVYEEEEGFFFEDLSDAGLDDDVLSRLLSFPNVLVTSHQGFFTEEALAQIAQTTLANIQAFLQGQPLDNEVSAT